MPVHSSPKPTHGGPARCIACAVLAASLSAAPVPASARTARTQSDPPADATAEGAPGDAPAEAQPVEVDPNSQKALELYLAGNRAYELGRFKDAAETFEQAWELVQEPMLLFNIGQALWRQYDVDHDVSHLRRARTFFDNYDRAMAGDPEHNPGEVRDKIKAIDAQIEAHASADEIAARKAELNAEKAKLEQAERRRRELLEQRAQVNRGLVISGNVGIILGSVAAGLAIGGISTRLGAEQFLTQSAGGDGTNFNDAEEDRRLRKAYKVGGELGFSGIVTAAILLPVGITLRAIGGARRSKDAAAQRALENSRARVGVTGSGLGVRF